MFPSLEAVAAGERLFAAGCALLGSRSFHPERPPERSNLRRECVLGTLSNTIELPPRLLVGAQTTADLEAAIRGGADIVDFSARGSDSERTRLIELVQLAALRAPRIGVSVALGELEDLLATEVRPVLPAGIRWARLGLAGSRSRSSWQRDWQHVRAAIDARAGRPLKWLAVAYSDAEFANSPRIGEVLDAAISTGCAGLFLETYDKAGGSIAAALTPCELSRLMWMARECRMPVFIGGGMGTGDLDWLCALEPCVIAAGPAVCDRDRPDQPVSELRVRRFKQSLEAAADFDRDAWDFQQQCLARRGHAESVTFAGPIL